MIDYSFLQKSLRNLELQNGNRRNLPEDLPDLLREAVDESVIQRFEICYDTLWKTLGRYLIEIEGLSEIPASSRGVFRLGGESGVLTSPVERWMEYVSLRIGTAHDYSSEKAAAALARIDEFIEDSIKLYEAMSGRAWD